MPIAPRLRADLLELDGGLRRLVVADGRHFDIADESRTLAALRLLDGHHTWPSVLGTFDSAEAASQFECWLRDNDVLLAPGTGAFGGLHVRLYGATGVGSILAPMLLAHGVHRLTLIDSTPVARNEDCTVAERLQDRLSTSGRDWARVRADRHWMPAAAVTDLAIIAGPSIEPDRAVLDALHRDGVPTLVVHVHHDSARVGPLHLPGRSPCWRCLDRDRTVDDPQWPRVAAHLARCPASPARPVAEWAAHHAILQLTSWLASGACGLIGTVLCWAGQRYGLSLVRLGGHDPCRCPR